MKFSRWLAVAGIAVMVSIPAFAPARSSNYDVVMNADSVLNNIPDMPLRAIPEALLRDAQGVAIFPGVVRAGFVAGVQKGSGVMFVRAADGKTWSAPSFASIVGGSFGWQVGVQRMDLILVFRTRQGIDPILRGQVTLGGEASVAAGPLGRDVQASTDVRFDAAVYSYSQSRGVFLGAAFTGAKISIDQSANNAYYRQEITPQTIFAGGPFDVPSEAYELMCDVAKWTRAPNPPVPKNLSSSDQGTAQQPTKAPAKKSKKSSGTR